MFLDQVVVRHPRRRSVIERAAAPSGIVCSSCEIQGRESVAVYIVAGMLLPVRVPGAWRIPEDRFTAMAQRVAQRLVAGMPVDGRSAALSRLAQARRGRTHPIAALEAALEALHERELARRLAAVDRERESRLALAA